MMALDWQPPGDGSKTEWQDTYSLIVCELKPGLILHGALAQVNGWGGRDRVRHEEGNQVSHMGSLA